MKTVESGYNQGFDDGKRYVKMMIKEKITEVEGRNPYKQIGEPDTYSKYNEGWSDACDAVRNKLTDRL